jgi:hypothetical protein
LRKRPHGKVVFDLGMGRGNPAKYSGRCQFAITGCMQNIMEGRKSYLPIARTKRERERERERER